MFNIQRVILMQKKKIFMYIILILLVIGICISFIYIFNFNKPEDKTENDIPEVTEPLVEKLYSYLPENETGLQSMYVGYYTTFNNIGSDIIQSMIYEYVLNYERDSIENVTTEDMEVNSITINGVNYNPSSKIKVTVFSDIFPLMFGKEATFNARDFRYSYNISVRLNETKDYYYIYENIDYQNNVNDIIFRDINKYAVTDNGETIEIYDYYLKCDLNNNNCYNDERKAKLNNQIKYTSDFNIENYKDDLVIYKHSFKYDNGNYYWFSSELA